MQQDIEIQQEVKPQQHRKSLESDSSVARKSDNKDSKVTGKGNKVKILAL